MSRPEPATIDRQGARRGWRAPAAAWSEGHAPPSCDPERFRRVIGYLPAGVTVVTTTHAGTRYGMTASAVTSVSLEPPLLLLRMNSETPTHRAVRRAARFAVNVLAEDQVDVAERFATPLDDKFDDVAVVDGLDGVPLLSDALAHVECEVVDDLPGGTHTVFLAGVRRARARSGSPLVHFRGSFRRVGRADAAPDDVEGGSHGPD